MTDLPTQPLVSIDVVPITRHDGRWCVIVTVRALPPYAGRAALPGVLLRPQERLAEAAYRALDTKSGIATESVLHLMHAGVFDNPDRDPRGPTLSIVHLAVIAAGSAPDSAIFLPIAHMGTMPFDHAAIIESVAGTALDALWVNEPLTRTLLPDPFSTADAKQIVRELSSAAGRTEPDNSNLGRNLTKNPSLVKDESPAGPTGRGRPAALWNWA